MVEITDEVNASHVTKKPRWWLMLLLAAVSILAGALAVGLPLVSSIAYSLFFGALLAGVGILQIAEVFTERRKNKKWWNVGTGTLAVFVGGLILLFPWGGVISLTLLVGWFFVLDAGLRFWSAAQPENSSNRAWIIASGALSLILGMIILIGLPETSLYTLGLLWGIHALFLGIALGRTAFRLRQQDS